MEDPKKLAAIKEAQEKFGVGIKFISLEEAAQNDFGPLTELVGATFESHGKDAKSPGWNVISVPGPTTSDGFVFEVIPYDEVLTFTPIKAALTVKNKGPFSNTTPATQQTQVLFGLMYHQIIKTVSLHNQNSEFDVVPVTSSNPNANIIHAEMGFFLYMNVDAKPPINPPIAIGAPQVIRLATIPHGNAVLAMGGFKTITAPPAIPNTFIIAKPNSTFPHLPNGTVLGAPYTNQITTQQFPGVFDQTDPNSFLIKTLGSENVVALTTINLDTTTNPDSGILSIPFLQNNIKTLDLNAVFWVETIKDAHGKEHVQLQYTQTINLQFPPTGSIQPIVWPHVTINTLQKV